MKRGQSRAAKVEVGVRIAQRWILARLRNQTFISLDALNDRIADLLEEFSGRTMRVYRATRASPAAAAVLVRAEGDGEAAPDARPPSATISLK